MEETSSSLSALQQNGEPVELTELFVQKKKTVTFSDTVTIQLILCLIAAIAFVAVNIVNNELAYDIYAVYNEKISADGNISDTIRIIVDFFRSTPLS